MRRFVLALATLVLLGSLAFVVFFTASKYRVKDQSYFASLSDFVFLIGAGNAKALRLDPPELTDRRYERVMAHARRTAHNHIKESVFRTFERWGAAVEPRLVEEIDLWRSDDRVLAAATVLARSKQPVAIRALEQALLTHHARWLEVRLIYELYKIGPEAAPALIDAYHGYLESDLEPPYNLLDSIGRAGGVGTDFLLAELDKASTKREILDLQWPLAYTKDPRAARRLFELMHHNSLGIRRRSRDSMSQSMGAVAVESAVDFLEQETDDFLKHWVIRHILASRRATKSRRAVDYLATLLVDPVLSGDASYALVRIGNDHANDVLYEHARLEPARWGVRHVEHFGAAGLRIFEDYSRDEDPYIRRRALWKLEERNDFKTAPIFRAALSDPDPKNRREAARLVFQTDLLLLGESFRVWLSDAYGEEIRGRVHLRGKGTRAAFGALRILHWIGLVVSVILGFLLLIGSLRAFEPFKFALILQFLIVAGVIGDFFLMSDPVAYRWATTARLVLVLGLLFLRDDPLPGEVRGRIERFSVRSILILAPALLVFGVPSFTHALRHALRDFDFMKWVALVLFVLTVLLLEQVVLPWHLFRRGSRLERAMTLVLSIAVVTIFVAALWLDSPGGDRATVNALLTLPLVIAIVFHTKSSRLFARSSQPPGLPPAPARFRVVRDRESVIVKLRPGRTFRGVPQFIIGALALWFLAAKLEVAKGGGPALLLLIFTAIFGTVLVWLLAAIVSPSFTIQIRDRAARSANYFLGGVLGRARWHRRLRLPALVGQLELEPTEKRWLARALDTT